jgi:hypothetical protein
MQRSFFFLHRPTVSTMTEDIRSPRLPAQDVDPRLPRRALLRSAIGASLAAPALGAPAWGQPSTKLSTLPTTRPAPSGDRWTPASASATQPSGAANGVNYWNKGTRLTISMWDFSWLLDSQPGGTFADLDRCLAQARERGYNTLRVDCFVAHHSRTSRPSSRTTTAPACRSGE